jgi:hypothetical protein
MDTLTIHNTFEDQIKDSKKIAVKIIKKVKQQNNSDKKDSNKESK